MDINDLKNKKSFTYAGIIKNRAIPHVLQLREEYTETLKTCRNGVVKEIYKKEGKEYPLEFDLENKDLINLCKELNESEKILKTAIKGIDVKFDFKNHDLKTDLEKIYKTKDHPKKVKSIKDNFLKYFSVNGTNKIQNKKHQMKNYQQQMSSLNKKFSDLGIDL